MYRYLFGLLILLALTQSATRAQVPLREPSIAAPPDIATPPADATKTGTGLFTKVLEPGTGTKKASASDVVSVHYSMWTTDGKIVDSTRTKGIPARFVLANVFPGWRECVTLMTIHEKRRCWAPQDLAYKAQKGRPTGMLVFDIELLGADLAPTVPPDLSKPPADAQHTPSGLAYKVLDPGTGVRNPSAFGRVTVDYTGWTTDGKMFDSSVIRGTPTTFSLDEVIKGWTEGVQLMVEGQRNRFWIPESLAYAQGGGPRGMLVFDIELIRIER
jgi:peptidylprolyl isomerase